MYLAIWPDLHTLYGAVTLSIGRSYQSINQRAADNFYSTLCTMRRKKVHTFGML